MIPESVFTASTDPDLHLPGDLVVYLHLHKHLDYQTFRPLKQVLVCGTTHMKQPSVSRALKRLNARGYVEGRPLENDRRAVEYRLTVCPPPTVAAAVGALERALAGRGLAV